MVPEKRIKTEEDLEHFLKSPHFAALWKFLEDLNESCKDKTIPRERPALSPFLAGFLAILNKLEQWVTEIPPVNQPTRFGNKAFRTWYEKLAENTAKLLEEALPEGLKEHAEELAAYLTTSFGNETRIDYGTGHEATFFVLLFCLDKIGAIDTSDYANVVLVIFPAYLDVSRQLQRTYLLEPAGSHGAWGLDDYSFLPFLWGSSQLVSQTEISTEAANKPGLVAQYADEYLYFGAIRYILEMKTGPFFEHSPILFNLTGVVGGWPKINGGMFKMYRAEVWGKRTVVQHLLFGEIFKYPE